MRQHCLLGQAFSRRLAVTIDDPDSSTDENPVIHADRPAKEMVVQITAFRVGAISVVNRQGELVGLVTDYDIRKALESDRNIASMSITEIMNTRPAVVYSD